MTDIIKDAKRLLDGATPAPWEPHPDLPKCLVNLETQFAVAVVPDSHIAGSEDESNRNLIAAAPELAQALAEETYFYGVQVWMGGRWIMMLTRDHGTSLMHRGKWFERKDEAQACAAKWNHDTPTRIVRQRRSPVEEINE